MTLMTESPGRAPRSTVTSAEAHSALLLHSGRVLTAPGSSATTVVVVGDRIVAVGEDAVRASVGAGVRSVDLAGRLVTPAFVDAHLHAVQTGQLTTGLDLHGLGSREELLDLVAARLARSRLTVLLGQGWDERSWPDPRPPTRAELDRAGGASVPVYLARVDVHSAVVSSGLADRVPGLAADVGFRADGWVRQEAHHRCRVAVNDLVSDADRRTAARAALAAAAELGVGTVHELGGPHLGPYADLARVVDVGGELGLRVVTYWAEPATPSLIAEVRADGVRGLAGDLCVDGAIGSRTAWLSAPYSDAPQAGEVGPAEVGGQYLSVEEITEHLRQCTRAGLTGGFHCIGDAAVTAAVTGLQRVAAELGVAAVRAARHRLEHVEMVTPEQIRVLARLGVAGSVQPAFDAAWGGPKELYEQRLGVDRARGMNPLGTWLQAGGPVAYGTDAPVTPLAGWAMVADAVRHHQPSQRVGLRAALTAATRGGHLAAGEEDAGWIAPGQRADLAIWDIAADGLGADQLPDLAGGAPLPSCAALLVGGRTVLDRVSG
jgi:predicted amidohydrolase YtcJ